MGWKCTLTPSKSKTFSCKLLQTRRVLHHYLNATATDDPLLLRGSETTNIPVQGELLKLPPLTTAPAEVATQNCEQNCENTPGQT